MDIHLNRSIITVTIRKTTFRRYGSKSGPAWHRVDGTKGAVTVQGTDADLLEFQFQQQLRQTGHE